MILLDRYILKRLLITFFFVVFILMTIITVIDITEKMEHYIKHSLSALQVASYYLDFIPFIASLITPLTAFIATVYITSRMASHTEIIAMLSGGMSFKRLMVPYILGGVIIGGLNFYLTGWVIPESNKDRIDFEVKYHNKPYVYTERDVHLQVGSNVYLYLRQFSSTTNVGFDFTLERIEETLLKEKLYAKELIWVDSTKKWRMRDWKHWEMIGEEEIVTKGEVLDTTLSITIQEFANDYRRFEGMSIPELDDYIEKLRSRGAGNVQIYEVEKYVRYTSPFTVLILTFMGVIVSVKKSRGGTGLRIAIGFTISFAFILCFILTKSIAEVGDLDPMIAVWIPNIIFGSISVFMYKTVPK